MTASIAFFQKDLSNFMALSSINLINTRFVVKRFTISHLDPVAKV